MSENNTSTTVSLGIGSVPLLWGIVTQCLAWGGVISWPWIAIWGPLLAVVAISLGILVICGGILLIASILKDR